MIQQDRVAVITGATGSLGSVLAHALAREGARLALLSTSDEKLQRLAAELDLPQDRVLTGAFDLTTADGARQAASFVSEKYGQIDMLLHVVGGWTGGKRVTDLPAEDVLNMLNQHLWSTFHLAQAFLPHLEANSWGRIVVVSSPFASNPSPELSAYVVGKAAQEALILSIASESARSGVTANIIQVRSIDATHQRDRAPSPKNASWTTPEEITAAILYLCSDEAQVVNGARIPLYGRT
jgi:NAD(P)-dependent dehydrogenase (short-subunit alcohol dehydrogenase family)